MRIKNTEDFIAAQERLGLTNTDVAKLFGLPNPEIAGRQQVGAWKGGHKATVKGPPPMARRLMQAMTESPELFKKWMSKI